MIASCQKIRRVIGNQGDRTDPVFPASNRNPAAAMCVIISRCVLSMYVSLVCFSLGARKPRNSLYDTCPGGF